MFKKITVLCREADEWTRDEGIALATKLKAVTKRNPGYPTILILDGERNKEQIAEVIGKNDFELTVINGGDNPDLFFPLFVLNA